MTRTEDKTETQVTSAAPELVVRARALIIEPEKSQELEAISMQATSAQPTGGERCVPTEEESEASEKTIMLEQIRTSQVKNMELTPTQERTVETRTVSPSSSGCQYGYGYLSRREKGEGIPDTCIECPKSLSCMLSEYYKKEESVKEIKKWYDF